jgi:hypothetical protein
LRTVSRPRRYVGRPWIKLLTPLLNYSYYRDAYVLRGIGDKYGPVLRLDRRARGEVDRRAWREQRLEGFEPGERFDRRRRRRSSLAA